MPAADWFPLAGTVVAGASVAAVWRSIRTGRRVRARHDQDAWARQERADAYVAFLTAWNRHLLVACTQEYWQEELHRLLTVVRAYGTEKAYQLGAEAIVSLEDAVHASEAGVKRDGRGDVDGLLDRTAYRKLVARVRVDLGVD